MAPIAADRRTWRVAVVDDSPDDRAEIRRLLLLGSERRYQFVEAETGSAVVRAVLDPTDRPPDCLVLDYNLPDLNATEVLSAIAGADGLPACPVVVITGSVGHELSREVLRAGAQDYIGKDWMTAESLARAVDNAAERWLMARELHAREAALRRSAGRDAFRLALADAIRPLADPSEVKEEAARVLGRHLGASRVVFAEVLSHDGLLIDRSDRDGECDAPDRRRIEDYGPLRLRELRAGRTVVVADPADDPDSGESEDSRSRADGIVAEISVPLLMDGLLIAVLGVYDGAARRWTEDEVTLAEDTAERTWAAVQRVRYEAALRAQDRRKDEFLATLAHELRNPLAPLRNGLQILRMGPGPEKAVEIREMMERQLAHLVRLVDDLLDVSRIRRGKIELRRGRIPLQAVIDHAVEASRPIIQAAGHDLIIRPYHRPIWLDGDLTRLVQVVGNLLNNAAKYTPDGGHIVLSAGLEAGSAVIRVTDAGIGLSPEMLPRVFDLFAQGDQALDRAQGGLGIGLSLVENLVKLHGGTIEADSPGQDLGSTFTVRLPVVSELVKESDYRSRIPDCEPISP